MTSYPETMAGRKGRDKPQNSDSENEQDEIYKGSRLYKKRKGSDDNHSSHSREDVGDTFMETLEKIRAPGVTKLKSIHDQARDAEKRAKRLKFDGSEVIDQKVIEMMQSRFGDYCRGK
jgi:hypothetical protein